MPANRGQPGTAQILAFVAAGWRFAGIFREISAKTSPPSVWQLAETAGTQGNLCQTQESGAISDFRAVGFDRFSRNTP